MRYQLVNQAPPELLFSPNLIVKPHLNDKAYKEYSLPARFILVLYDTSTKSCKHVLVSGKDAEKIMQAPKKHPQNLALLTFDGQPAVLSSQEMKETLQTHKSEFE